VDPAAAAVAGLHTVAAAVAAGVVRADVAAVVVVAVAGAVREDINPD
jgi:hypothetical protein